jgi:signal transduction histidine kinase
MRIIMGILRLDVGLVELTPIIEAAMDVVRPADDAKNVKLSSTLDPMAGPVSGDANRLQQIVWNLLSNAVKFTPTGGRIEVRLERADNQVRVIVNDSGAGISAEFLPFVFDRSRQADGTTAKPHGGLGLGLAIVRQIVELHGGTIHAYSEGKGLGLASATGGAAFLPDGDKDLDKVFRQKRPSERSEEQICRRPN